MNTSESIIVIVSMIAIISTIGFLCLWFLIVKKEMKLYKDAVDSADYKLKEYRLKYMQAMDSPREEYLKNVLLLGLDVFVQTAKDYNRIRKKPQNIIPAMLMGFRKVASTKSIVTLIDEKNQKFAG